MIYFLLLECNEDSLDPNIVSHYITSILNNGYGINNRKFDLHHNPITFFTVKDVEQIAFLDELEIKEKDEIVICLVTQGHIYPTQKHFDVANVSKTCQFYERVKQFHGKTHPLILYV
jgi:hypothetical protein